MLLPIKAKQRKSDNPETAERMPRVGKLFRVQFCLPNELSYSPMKRFVRSRTVKAAKIIRGKKNVYLIQRMRIVIFYRL